jgi:hypothetical protein
MGNILDTNSGMSYLMGSPEYLMAQAYQPVYMVRTNLKDL